MPVEISHSDFGDLIISVPIPTSVHDQRATLSEIAQASQRQYEPAIGLLSDDMPKFCTLAAEFNSCSACQSATIRRLQRLCPRTLCKEVIMLRKTMIAL